MRDFASFIPGDVEWGAHLERIPFSGNIDNKRLIDFVKKIEHRWKPPRSTLGGTDLDLIRRIRNDLAHGKEAFESVGAQFDSDDLIQKFGRARSFTVSLIRSLERYGNERKYLTK